MTVCTIATAHGAIYTIKRISAEPRRYVAFVEGPVEKGPLHRDGVELSEAMEKIAACIMGAELTMDAINGLLAGARR